MDEEGGGEEEECRRVDPRKMYDNFIRKHCLGKTHRKSFNEWMRGAIYQNMRSGIAKRADGYTITCTNLRIETPSYIQNKKQYKLTPAYAKKQQLTYAVNLLATMALNDPDGKQIDTKKDIPVGYVPVMLKSEKCNLYGMSDKELVACGEDPTDPGGYFIVNGAEYMVMYLEKLDLDKFILNCNKKEKGDMDVSITTLNESRKTSKQVVYFSKVRQMIMVYLPSLSTSGFSRMQCSVNLYHILDILKLDISSMFEPLLKLYFTSRDKELHEKLLSFLCINKANFEENSNSVAVIGAMLPNSSKMSDEEREAAVLLKVQEELFAHLGFYFAEMDSMEAAQYRNTNRVHLLAYCTAMLLEYQGGVRSESDRDSWANKRIEAGSKAMEYLLKHAWASKMAMVAKLSGAVDDRLMTKVENVLLNSQKPLITDSFITSFVTPKWGVKHKRTMKTDRAQYFQQESPVYLMALLDQIQVTMSRRRRRS